MWYAAESYLINRMGIGNAAERRRDRQRATNPKRGGETVNDHSCLIRYGLMSHVGRFSTSPVREGSLERGQLVVIQTDRGVELGEILTVFDRHAEPVAEGPGPPAQASSGEEDGPSVSVNSPHVLRVAGPADLACSRDADELRSSRFSMCQRILREANWPWELLDVEPLLDGQARRSSITSAHIRLSSLRYVRASASSATSM